MKLYSYHLYLALISFLLMIIIYLFLNPFYGLVCQASALVSLMFVMYNILLFIKTKERRHLLITPVLILTWVYFLRPYLKTTPVEYVNRTILPEYLNAMAVFSALGVISIYFGYYLFNKKNVKPLAPSDFILSTNIIGNLVLIFLFLSILYRIFIIFFSGLFLMSGAILQLWPYCATLSFAFLILYLLRGGKAMFIITSSIVVMSIEYFFRVAETLFANVIFLFIGGLIVYILEKKKIPYVILIVFFILNYPIYKTRSKYRMENVVDRWYGGENVSYMEVVSEGFDNLVEIYSNLSFKDYLPDKDEDTNATDRMEQVSYLGQCVNMHVNKLQTFKNGSTFCWLPLTPIPRIIFPWKPENLMATQVAQEYGLKGESHGAMNFPMLVEFYINFGFWGIVFLSFLQGIAIKWMFSKVGFGFGDINLIILLNLFIYVLRVEANVTLIFGGILQTLLFWWILLKFLDLKKNKA